MKTYERFQDEDVVFLGLSPEADFRAIESWKERLEIPWSLGYDANATLQQFEIPGYPTTFVIGRDGKVVWHSFQDGSLSAAIRKALEQS